MAEIFFNVSARTARLIGLENFANTEGAVIELVKNCYDADASIAIVLFNNDAIDPSDHFIVLADNGSGMTSEIIKNNWMLIGTNNKETTSISENGRIRSGAKGIGRFALDKLGVNAEMLTVTEGSGEANLWKVNWDDFLKPNVRLSDVKASLDPMLGVNFKQQVLEYLGNTPRIADVVNEHNFDNGTIIKISNLRDSWKNDELQRLYNNLELLIPPQEQSDFNISLFSTIAPKSFGNIPSAFYDDYDYKVEAKTDINNPELLNIIITRDELDDDQLLLNYPELFETDRFLNSKISIENFRKKPTKYNLSLSELARGYSDLEEGEELLSKIGAFEFSCYFLKNTVSDDSDEGKYPYKPINSPSRKAWLKKFGGIKIFRDGFRVRPYGEYGQDWLLLGERQAQSPGGPGQRLGGYKLRPNQLAGTINISRLTNKSFQDKSGREGIQENLVFEVFKGIIVNLISQIEKDRNIVMYSISQLYKSKNKDAEAKILAAELSKKALEDAAKAEQAKNDQDKKDKENREKPEGSLNQEELGIGIEKSNDVVLNLAKGFEAQQSELREKDDEIRLLRGLSGVGLIVASFAHELRNIKPLLVTRVESLIKILKTKVDLNTFAHLNDYEHPISILSDMKDQDVLIKHWLEYSLSALKKDKRTRTNIDLIDYFFGFESKWKAVLEKRLVKFSFIKPVLERPVLRGFSVDLDTIFNNLLTNSLESFKKIDRNISRKIDLELSVNNNKIQIYFEDNGAGLSKDFSNPEDIFLPFETSKIDKYGKAIGTGLGMYLTRSIVDEYDGEIKIIRTNPGFKLGISLPIKYK